MTGTVTTETVKATPTRSIGGQIAPIHTDGTVTPRNYNGANKDVINGANKGIIPARTRCLPHHPHHHRRALARHIGAMGGVDLTIAGLTVAVLHHDAETSRHIAGDTNQDPQSPEGQLPLRATQVPKIHIYEQQHSDGTSTLTSINSNPGGGPHTNIVSVEQDPETGQPVVDLVINDPKLRDMEAIVSYLQSKSDIGAVRVAMHAVHPRKNKDDTKTLIPPWTFDPRDGQPSVVPSPPQAKDNTGIQVDTQRHARFKYASGASR
ncbi:hypothetical protein V2G26_017769 [Clonostachys chloroleuca]